MALAVGAGCAKKTERSGLVFQDPKLIPYLVKFESMAQQRGVSVDTSGVTVSLSEKLDTQAMIGRCISEASTGRGISITILKSFWDSAIDDISREEIIFHELGHCTLGRTHDASVVAISSINGSFESFPRSIMNPVNLGITYYNNTSRNYYLGELFDRSKASSLSTSLAVDEDFYMSGAMGVVAKTGDTVPFDIEYYTFDYRRIPIDKSKCTLISIKDVFLQLQDASQAITFYNTFSSFKINRAGEYIVDIVCDHIRLAYHFTGN